ncbi:hypothetical protein LXA43DRAFT_1111474 [Ganoderma leucocontextum]|nr:hypothetical protein LXA43DRAFT_1111474 [Ganoderma leucocontextum]
MGKERSKNKKDQQDKDSNCNPGSSSGFPRQSRAAWELDAESSDLEEFVGPDLLDENIFAHVVQQNSRRSADAVGSASTILRPSSASSEHPQYQAPRASSLEYVDPRPATSGISGGAQRDPDADAQHASANLGDEDVDDGVLEKETGRPGDHALGATCYVLAQLQQQADIIYGTALEFASRRPSGSYTHSWFAGETTPRGLTIRLASSGQPANRVGLSGAYVLGKVGEVVIELGEGAVDASGGHAPHCALRKENEVCRRTVKPTFHGPRHAPHGAHSERR